MLLRHCSDDRFIHNLAVEQRSWYQKDGPRGPAPGFAAWCRMLTEARADNPWLAEGSADIQQQALKDFERDYQRWFTMLAKPAIVVKPDPPGFRKKGFSEGFSVAGKAVQVEKLNRKWSRIRVPKVGWVKFRTSRPVPEAKGYRVTLDAAGRWHIAFRAIPGPVAGPGTGEIVGIDRGVKVTLQLSDGSSYQAPDPLSDRQAEKRLSRAKRGSNRRKQAKLALARLRARDASRRKDWAEKASTDIARRFDVIRIEDLKIQNMTRSAKGTIDNPGKRVAQKSGLNRSILQQGWGLFARRLEDKAAGRVEKINPQFTSQRCSRCGHVDAKSRESQARFACTACSFVCNADLNAAKNIAAGHAVRRDSNAESLKRELLVA